MPPPPRQDFPPFPFVPYPIQTEFMSILYSALSSGPRALALLESPTGTGKTLSIICSALQWLLDHRDAASLGHPERANGSAPAAVGGEDDEPDWMRDFTLQPLPPKKDIRKKSETHPSRRHGTKKVGGSEKSERIRENDDEEEFLLDEYESDDGEGGSEKSERIRENDDEEEFLLDEYESDDGEGTGRQAGKRAHCGGASSSSSSESEDDEDEEEATPKVYFTSRTHSQLSQFVGELKRTNFSGKLRTVCLGSRKSLRINMDVQKPGSANRINERCLELLKNKKSSKIKVEGDNKKGRQTKASCRCPMLGNRSLQKQFRSEVSDHGPLDIEDLAQLGRKIGTCPYYGARDMVRSADLVVLPYQSLLLKSARELLGLNLKNSVVIIDEAHNLADSLTSMYNSKLESSQVTDDAHAVILAGGTLQPIEEKRLRLFPGLLPSDIKFFSCNHIVPPESILPIAVTCGPSGKKFDFSHSSRSSLNMIEELGRFLCNIVTIVPEGIVMFLSSYEYEKQVYDAWMASGTISKISKKKHVFREPRSSVDVEVILNKYKEAIQSCSKGSGDTSVNGALLLAVVGGKISEGINFSDGMGRCVLMVGLLYPSPDDIELMETIKHIGNYSTSSVIGDDKPFNGNDECKLEPGFDVLRKSGKSGREYYENLCMKAVNQSIGRAIRHVNDYAAMLLVDSRYAHTSSSRGFSCPVEKLPQWIKTRLTCGQNYGEVHRLLLQFFKINKQIH
ncbi:hypothetical protein VPH35_001612 [Triticum aestivum]|uniref:ATP-dependent DNA helicase DDX11 isoform X1 n=1 Tax=Triticum aestivum TaxID=4565 RepID=UPI001D01EE65|nr:ATP-dependent DNA helicase DDX11-like isoform X1 [Triticum aestivum]